MHRAGSAMAAPPKVTRSGTQLRGLPMFHQPFERFGRWITRRYWAVLIVWIIAIGAAIPFALRLPDVISKQGASKLVPGTESFAAERLIGTAFPQRSELQSFVVVSADDVRGAETR